MKEVHIIDSPVTNIMDACGSQAASGQEQGPKGYPHERPSYVAQCY